MLRVYNNPSACMPKHSAQNTRKKAFIVEDSPDFSSLLQFLLQGLGIESVQFPLDGQDIVEWAKQHKPAVILMDLALKRKTGKEFISDLKSDPETKQIPVIVITGRDLTQKEILELKVLDVKYLRKGRVDLDEIRNEIRRSVRQGADPLPAQDETKT